MKNKLLLLMFTLLCSVGSWATDEITYSTTKEGMGTTNSTTWKVITVNGESGAEYTIRSMGTTGTSYAARWNANGYLCAKTSSKILKSVTVVAAKSVKVYASNKPYTNSSTELPAGTLLTTLNPNENGATYTFEGEYMYIALVGGSSSCNVTSIFIEYQGEEIVIDPLSVTLADTKETLTEKKYGDGVTLPQRGDVGEYSFVGWSKGEITNESTIKPSYILPGSYKPEDNITLYPVYVKSVTSEGAGQTTVSTTMEDYAIANEWETNNNTTKYHEVKLDEKVKVVADEKGTTGQWNPTSKYWGMYQASTNLSVWRIVGEDDVELKQAVFTYTSNNTGIMSYGGTTYESGIAVNLSGTTSDDFTVANTSTASNGQVRITAISVTYEATGLTSRYYTSYPKSTITIASACTDGKTCYSTYSNSSSFVVPEGLTVSTVGVTEGKLVVNSYETGDVVAANTGIMVSGEAGGHDVVLTNEAATEAPGANNLHPSSEPMTGDNLFYRLTMHNGTQIGYWWGAADGAAFNLAANKAYLAVPKVAGVSLANGFTFESDITTLIDAVKNTEKANGVAYNLNGQRVSANTKGFVIINGHKYLNK